MTNPSDTPIALKNPRFAALLAWLVPGLGHLYQGRTSKGLLFLLTIAPLFVAGMYAGGGRVAYASPLPLLPNPASFVVDRWPFPCQAGIGVVAIPALVERARFQRDAEPLLGGVFHPPKTGASVRRPFTSLDNAQSEVRHPDELAKWHYDYGYFFELGTVYTAIAGLLNILAVYDAHSGPLVPTDKKAPSPDPPPA
ncbi:MAG: DUF6677 family protein [Lacipirellulaceae bacterium]